MYNKKSKKALGAVVATALFLVVAVVSVMSFQSFYKNYQSEIFTKAETTTDSTKVGIETIFNGELYFKNNQNSNVTIKSVMVGGINCNVTEFNITGNKMQKINVSGCVQAMTDAKSEIVVVTDKKIFSKYQYFKNNVVYNSYSGSVTVVGNLTVAFVASPNCAANYTKVLGYFAQNNSHVSLPDQLGVSYSLCLDHQSYNIGTSCSVGSHERVFYLGAENNSHIWIDNSTAYDGGVGYYDWQELCISSSDATLDLVYNTSDMTAAGYATLLSYAQNDTYGGIIGEANQNTKKIWIKFS